MAGHRSSLDEGALLWFFTGRVELSHSPVASRHTADAHVLLPGSSVTWLSQNHVASLLLYIGGRVVTKCLPGLEEGRQGILLFMGNKVKKSRQDGDQRTDLLRTSLKT